MKISDKLQLGFITAGNTIRITCTNTYVKPKNKTPKIKVNLFDTDGVKIENPEPTVLITFSLRTFQILSLVVTLY